MEPTINLYHGDCMEAMRAMKDKAYDLAIVDPPYGISQPAFRIESKNKAARPKDYHNAVYNQLAPDKNYFSDLERISRNRIIWGGNYYNDVLPVGKKWIFWDKKTEETQWGDGELAFTSFNGAIAKFVFAWNGMIQGNMKEKENRIHPTQKPVALYKWLLKNYAKPGDKILDTHGGSMSIAIACFDMGFDLDLWEIDKDYYEAGVRRFNDHKKQLKLFRA
jgi:site-specific DNA-methyltransferase (adenine-specific)